MSHLRAIGIEFLTIIAVLIVMSALQNSSTAFHILAAAIVLAVVFVCSSRLVLWQIRERNGGPLVFRLRTAATPKKLIAGIALAGLASAFSLGDFFLRYISLSGYDPLLFAIAAALGALWLESFRNPLEI